MANPLLGHVADHRDAFRGIILDAFLQLLVADRMSVDVGPIDVSRRDDRVQEPVHQRHVGARSRCQVHGRDLRHRRRPGSTQISCGGLGPASRSSTRIHSTLCVSAMLWPNNAITLAWSMSVYVPGWPSHPNDSFSDAAAVAVHSRVLPSRWLVPIPPCAMAASV